MQRHPCVYLMASARNGTLYCGVTSDPVARAWQHRTHAVDGFTKRYGVTRLVWYELHPTMDSAIRREKQVKRWNRARKLRLIELFNPAWCALWPEIAGSHHHGDFTGSPPTRG